MRGETERMLIMVGRVNWASGAVRAYGGINVQSVD